VLEGASVFAIVPCFNVRRLVPEVVATMPAFVDQMFVVDDGSEDGTAEWLQGIAGARVTPILHPRNLGVGAALASGYRAALATSGTARDAFLVLAGDGQMDPDDARDVALPVVRGEVDYAKGNRFLGDASEMPLSRRVVGELTSVATRFVTGFAVSDAQCGYTAVSRAACARLDLEGLWPRYGYPNDLLGQLAVRGARVADVPVRARYRGEPSGLRKRDVARIFALIARAGVRVLSHQDLFQRGPFKVLFSHSNGR